MYFHSIDLLDFYTFRNFESRNSFIWLCTSCFSCIHPNSLQKLTFKWEESSLFVPQINYRISHIKLGWLFLRKSKNKDFKNGVEYLFCGLLLFRLKKWFDQKQDFRKKTFCFGLFVQQQKAKNFNNPHFVKHQQVFNSI